MATCGVLCAQRPGGRPFEGSCTVASLEFATGATRRCIPSTSRGLRCAGRRRHALLHCGSSAVDAATHMLTASCAPVAADATTTASFVRAGAVGATGAADASLNEILLVPPAALTLPPAAVTATVAQAANADGTVDVTLKANATALYVTLTGASPTPRRRRRSSSSSPSTASTRASSSARCASSTRPSGSEASGGEPYVLKIALVLRHRVHDRVPSGQFPQRGRFDGERSGGRGERAAALLEVAAVLWVQPDGRAVGAESVRVRLRKDAARHDGKRLARRE